MAQSIEEPLFAGEPVCERNVMVAMRDGVRLAADIYFPATPATCKR